MKTHITFLILSLLMIGVGCAQPGNDTASRTVTQAEVTTPRVAGQVIDMRNQGRRRVPDNVVSQADVTSLLLSGNELEGALPAEIRHMRALEVLNVSNNRMTGVPAEVGQLQNLRILDLSDNQLTGLPYELGNLQQLELLDISGNDYSEQDLARIEEMLPESTVIRR